MCAIKQKERKRNQKAYNISSSFYSTIVKNFTVLTKQSNKMFMSKKIDSKNFRIKIQIFQHQQKSNNEKNNTHC